MSKRKPRRSREFKKNSQVIDIEEARRERREKREQAAKAEKKRRAQEPERQPESVRRKTKRNRRRLIYAAIILFIAVTVGASAFNILSLRHEKAELEAEQARLLMMRDRLQEELKVVNSPEYIEQQARSHLRLIKPGEILFVLPDGAAQDGNDGQDGSEGSAAQDENGGQGNGAQSGESGGAPQTDSGEAVQ